LENVAGLLSGPSEQPGQWFGRILGDLASIGYDAEWENIPAASVGAPHRRERVWIVAYSQEKRTKQGVQVFSSGELSRELRGVVRQNGVFGVDNPRVSNVDDGLPIELGGYFAAGNAVVPQIPELIGRAILAGEAGAQ
jgi:DNA (cytosine-5)-methyltransferase 1